MYLLCNALLCVSVSNVLYCVCKHYVHTVDEHNGKININIITFI